MTEPNHIVPALEPALTRPDGSDGTGVGITLTPDDARAILLHMGCLRETEIDWGLVGMLADSMQADEWPTGGQIMFLVSDTGEATLFDGHHRLHAAIVASWTGFWIVTGLWNCKDSARDMHRIINSNRLPRTDADIGHNLFADRLSPEMQSIIITAARYQNEWSSEYRLPEHCHTPPLRDNIARARELLEAFKQADLIINNADVLSRTKRRLMTPMVLAVVTTTLEASPQDATTFWKAVVTGGQGVAGTLRAELMRGRPRGASKHYWPRLVGQAWNDYMTDV